MTKNYYDQNAKGFIAQTQGVDMSGLYDRFLPHIPPKGAILDAGSGSGRDAHAFTKLGYDVSAFDASAQMVAETRRFANVPTFKMTFQSFRFDGVFDGIWANASLLHIRRTDLTAAFIRLSAHTIDNGVIYASFKYGTQERETDGRLFCDLNEDGLNHVIHPIPDLTLLDLWTTSDKRPKRHKEIWLNCILKKTNHGQSVT